MAGRPPISSTTSRSCWANERAGGNDGVERSVRRWWAAASSITAVVLLAATAWAAFAPVPVPADREQPFVIPEGTWARRMSGDRVDILPQHIRLTLGINDV